MKGEEAGWEEVREALGRDVNGLERVLGRLGPLWRLMLSCCVAGDWQNFKDLGKEWSLVLINKPSVVVGHWEQAVQQVIGEFFFFFLDLFSSVEESRYTGQNDCLKQIDLVLC